MVMTRSAFTCYNYVVIQSVSHWSSFSNSPWKEVLFCLIGKKGMWFQKRLPCLKTCHLVSLQPIHGKLIANEMFKFFIENGLVSPK